MCAFTFRKEERAKKTRGKKPKNWKHTTNAREEIYDSFASISTRLEARHHITVHWRLTYHKRMQSGFNVNVNLVTPPNVHAKNVPIKLNLIKWKTLKQKCSAVAKRQHGDEICKNTIVLLLLLHNALFCECFHQVQFSNVKCLKNLE